MPPLQQFNCMEKPVKKRGRPTDPDALQFRGVGLRPRDWAYLAQWQTEEEKQEGNAAKGGNFTPALERAFELLRTLAPGGEGVGKPRDEKGRFLPGGGTSKSARTRARKRAKKEAGQ